MTKNIRFTKMHGAGNDYIYVDVRQTSLDAPEELAVRLSRPHFSIGSDGLILIGSSNVADFSMRIFNNDGSEALMCGNGVRCVGKYVYDKGLTDKKEIRVETLSGIKVLTLQVAQGKVAQVTVDMGEPVLYNKELLATETGGMLEGEVSVEGETFRGTFVSMGNPHFVIFVSDIAKIDLKKTGAQLENSKLFPQRCNIEFAEVKPDGRLRTRVWERGSGVTLACGTGACATAVAAHLTGRAGRNAVVAMDGGDLSITWDEATGHLFMTGPASIAFEGEIEPD